MKRYKAITVDEYVDKVTGEERKYYHKVGEARIMPDDMGFLNIYLLNKQRIYLMPHDYNPWERDGGKLIEDYKDENTH